LSVVGPYANPRTISKADEAKAELRRAEKADALDSLKLRSRRTVERKMELDEIKYSYAKKTFVYVEDEDKVFEVTKLDDGDDYGDEGFSDKNDGEDDDDKVPAAENDNKIDEEDEEKYGDTEIENVDKELDAMNNEKIETKFAEVFGEETKI
jgi:hypothetical protein